MMEKFLTTVQLADRLQMKVSTIRAWVFQRRIPFKRVGRRAVRFDPNEIERFLKSVPALRPVPGADGNGRGAQ
jgi:excisionase family DNA binding protein